MLICACSVQVLIAHDQSIPGMGGYTAKTISKLVPQEWQSARKQARTHPVIVRFVSKRKKPGFMIKKKRKLKENDI